MITDVLEYYRTKLNALGLKEHDDVFDITNIPENTSDKTYALEWLPTAGVDQNLVNLTIDQSIVLRVFVEGFKNPRLTRDTAISRADSYMKSLLDHYNNNATSVKNMTLNSFNITPISTTNNKDMLIELVTTARIYDCAFEGTP